MLEDNVWKTFNNKLRTKRFNVVLSMHWLIEGAGGVVLNICNSKTTHLTFNWRVLHCLNEGADGADVANVRGIFEIIIFSYKIDNIL